MKALFRKIDKNLKGCKTRLHKKLNSIKGGNLGDNYEYGGKSAEETEDKESAEDKKKKEEIEKLENAAEKKVEDLVGKDMQRKIEKAKRIEQLFMAVDSIIEDPSSAQEQMNILLGASMNIDPEKIKEGAVAVYAVLQTIDTDAIMAQAKEVAETAKQAMNALPLDQGDGTGVGAQAMALGKDLANDPNVQNAIGEVKEAVGQAADQTKQALGEAKQALGEAKQALGDVKNVVADVKSAVGDAKAIGAELLKNIPPEQTAAAAAAASTAASAISSIAENIDTEAIMNTLSTVASAFEPIMEIGASIPGLGVCLLLVNKLMKQYRESKELKEILEDMQDSINNSMLLIKLIKTTMSIYQMDSASYYSAQTQLLSEKIGKTKKDKDKKNLEKSLKLLFKEAGYLSKIQLNPSIEAKVSSKVQNIMETMKRLLPEAAPTNTDQKRSMVGKMINFTKRQFSKISAFYNRFGMASFYKAQILKNLNIVNNLLIIYNSQFEWAQSSFIMRIKDKAIKDQKLLDLIWTRVEGSQEFKDYLWHDDGPAVQQGGRTRKGGRRPNNRRKTVRRR